MRHRVLATLAVASLAISFALFCLTLRSMSRSDSFRLSELQWIPGQGRQAMGLLLESRDRCVLLIFSSELGPYSPQPDNNNRHYRSDFSSSRFYSSTRGPYFFSFAHMPLPHGGTNQIIIPFWVLIVLTAGLPILWMMRQRRRRLLLSAGMCMQCGYDLRATPLRCPECGTAVAGN